MIRLNSIEYRVLSWVALLLPLSFLGSGTLLFLIMRLLLIIPLGIITIGNYRSNRKGNILFIILFFISFLFILREKVFSLFLSLTIIIIMYLFFLKSNISFMIKRNIMHKIYFGCLIAGMLGFLYMVVTGNYIKGGEYTQNNLNISNLTVPLFLCLYINYSFFLFIDNSKRKYYQIFVIILLLLIVFFLGKRGPLLFCFLSIVLSFFVVSPLIKKMLLLIVFAYPFYEISIIQIVVNNTTLISQYVDRLNDFSDVEDNPRVYRLFVAEAFVSDYDISDLIGYHRKLVIAKNEYDKAHNHFHNTLLQLYYERGLLSVVAIFLLLLTSKFSTKDNSSDSKISFASLLLLFLIGTNESTLKTGSVAEFLSMIIIMFSFSLNESKKYI